jgi:transcriptional regulator with XRE-family HTH domain
MVTILTMMVPLKMWREKRGLSMRGLASRAGVSHVAILKIESGKISPTVAMLEKLAEALGITVRDFFPAEEPSERRGQRRRHGGGGQSK